MHQMSHEPQNSGFQFVAFKIASLLAQALLVACVSGCQQQKARNETAVLLTNLDQLRTATNERKREPLEKLKSSTCTDTDVCLAKEACAQAFEHHVRSVELGSRLKTSLDSNPSPSPSEREAMRASLLEANIEIEEGQRAMPDCESRIAELRLKHRL